MAGIKVTMKQSYNDVVFGFRNCSEAGKFMDTAMEAAMEAGKEISFSVEPKEKKAAEADKATGEAGGKDA